MFQIKKTTIVNSLLSIIISVFAVALITYAAWSEPTVAPTGGNVPAPINIGSESQVKSGALGVGGVFRAFSDLIVDGNVGIGTTGPNSSKGTSGYLDVEDVYIRSIDKWASELGGPVTYPKSQSFSGPSSTSGSLYCDGSDVRLSGGASGCGVGDDTESWCANGPVSPNGWQACCYDADGGGVNFTIDLVCQR